MRSKVHGPKLSLRGVGPLVETDLELGDLTVFVGPQASGKSIALQWLKLLTDSPAVKAQFTDYGTDWAANLTAFLTLYFGEGMGSIWREGTSAVSWKGKPVDLSRLVKRKTTKGDEHTFLIPAQRVLTLRDGWPRPFGDYGAGDPYSVRAFSEKLRMLMEEEFKVGTALFPQSNRLKSAYRTMLAESIFGDFNLTMVRAHSQKKLVLQNSNGQSGENDLAYMVWSAGQREFVPLLLGLYWLMPPSRVAKRKNIEWVIIEELEMGLHPRAIGTVLLLIVELIARGYKVCLSTHSPQILEFVWAWRALHATGSPVASQLLDLLDAPHSKPLLDVAKDALSKECKVFYFERNQKTLDITNLDPASMTEAESSWGGLLSFSGKANEVVANAVANSAVKQSRLALQDSSH